MIEQEQRVLVVEDNTPIRHSLALLLEREGFDVVAVAEYEKGLDLLHERPFDALVADLDLPGGTGTGMDLLLTARCLRPRIRCILMTGFGCSAIRKQADELGLTGYLEKPFEAADLLELLRDRVPAGRYSLSSSPARTS